MNLSQDIDDIDKKIAEKIIADFISENQNKASSDI